MSAARKIQRTARNAKHSVQRQSARRADFLLKPVPHMIERGDREQSLARVQQALAIEPNHPGAHCELAALSLSMRDFAQTAILLNEAERLGGEHVRSRASAIRGDMAYLQNRLAEAEAAYQVAVAAGTDTSPEATVARGLLGLGRIELTREQAERALEKLREAARLDPQSHAIQQTLARALDTVGDQLGAFNAYQAALKLKGDDAGLLNDMGGLLSRLKRLEEAAKAFEIAIKIKPNLTISYNNLGITLYQLRRFDDAARVFEACLKREPSNAFAQHMAAAMRGDGAPGRASDDYVKLTFDNFAESFDAKLGRLQYRAPELLGEVISEILGDPAGVLSVLDAGCGTGLCGPFLRPYARSLVGVDLSPGMLKKAEDRGIYDELLAAEITAFVEERPSSYNLIVAADVLCYFGEMAGFMSAAAGALKPGGYLAYTVERFEGDGPFKLHPHGRYSHSEAYVRELAVGAGLRIVTLKTDVLRLEGRDPVHGFVVVLEKRVACCG